MGKFKVTKTDIESLVVIEPEVFGDNRGFFMESYSKRDFADAGINVDFVQDNHSKSKKGVLRGLHFQHTVVQGKLVRVVAGSVLDIVVDLRSDSSSFGRWFGVELSAENKKQIYVPEGFAHGFLTLEDNTELLYKCTNYYSPENEGGIIWNDPTVGVDWMLEKYNITELIISDKDKKLPLIDSIKWKEIF